MLLEASHQFEEQYRFRRDLLLVSSLNDSTPPDFHKAPRALGILAVMFATSASFITPLGYQTNLMVYGPGRYRFTDYVRIGAPLSVLVGNVAVGLIPVVWGFE